MTGRGRSVLNGLGRRRCEEEGIRLGEGFTLSRTTTDSFYHTMSLKLLMSADHLLKEVFTDYLKLPVSDCMIIYLFIHLRLLDHRSSVARKSVVLKCGK